MSRIAFEYKVVIEKISRVREFEKEIQSLTESGWILHGGLNVSTSDEGIFVQALIKEFESPGAWG